MKKSIPIKIDKETNSPRVGRYVALVAVAAMLACLAYFGLAGTTRTSARETDPPVPPDQTQQQSLETDDAAVWGKRFPVHYADYMKTVDQTRTRYGGSEATQRTPSEADPRSVVSQSRLEEDPRLKTMWDGYAFAVDFREERGHAFMLDDQT